MKRLVRRLDVPLYAAAGILELIWHLTAREAPQGNIGKLEDADIADAVGWSGDPEQLIGALADTGWLDRSKEHRLIVHDWHEHADDAVRKALARSKLTFLSCDQPAPEFGPWVYFIQAGTGEIKIGFTEGSPEARLYALQTAAPTTLKLLGVIRGTRREELALHKRFAGHASSGEWFSPATELLEYIRANVEQRRTAADNGILPEPSQSLSQSLAPAEPPMSPLALNEPPPAVDVSVMSRVLCEKVGIADMRDQRSMHQLFGSYLRHHPDIAMGDAVEHMAGRWLEYQRAGPELKWRYGSSYKFFMSGKWDNPEQWERKDGSSSAESKLQQAKRRALELGRRPLVPAGDGSRS